MIDLRGLARAYCDEIRAVTDRTYECPLCGQSPQSLSIDHSCDFGNFQIKGRHASWRCRPCRVWVILQA